MKRHSDAALSVQGLSKTFGTQVALDNFDIEVTRGEVHALLGQNGSGKSTLIKILSGYHHADAGASASINGNPLALGSAMAAHEAGIRFIHQDLALLDDRDVVDNLALGASYSGRFWLSNRQEHRAADQYLRQYGVEVDVGAPIADLSPARRSMIAILRALRDGLGDGGLLVLDEPTVSLGEDDVALLFGLIRELRSRGCTVIYVTHRLNEVFAIADRVTVLRDGRRIATRPTSELDHDGLAELIVGRPLSSFYPELPPPRSDVLLSVRGIAGGGVRDLSFDLHRGEVLGLAGLVGSGFDEVLPLAFGAVPPTRGEIQVGEKTLAPPTPRNSIKAGIAFAPADRKRFAAIMPWTLRENVTLPSLISRGPARWMSRRREAEDARPWLRKLGIVPEEPEALFSSLSGGNQQRVVLARWLRCGAGVFLLDEPTNGVDVGAKHGIYEVLAEAAYEGAGMVVASSDAEELCAVCDRIIVMRGGIQVAELGSEAAPDQIFSASLDADLTTTEVKPQCMSQRPS